MSKLFKSALLLFFSLNLYGQDNTSLKEINNIPYYENKGADSALTQLNLILPTDATNPPVLIWIGQGAWAYVSRHVEMNICRRFAEGGIAVVSAGHRLSPALLTDQKREEGVKHPEHIKDRKSFQMGVRSR